MRGSLSEFEGTRNRRFECVTEKTDIGGEALERYRSEGRGVGWARKRVRSTVAAGGRPR